MNDELQGKVAIVTGGAGGIGTHLSKTFAAAGARVVVAKMPYTARATRTETAA